MGLGSLLKGHGYTQVEEGLWRPPNDWWPDDVPNPKKEMAELVFLLRNELFADREQFIKVFGKAMANRLDGEEMRGYMIRKEEHSEKEL